MRSDQRSDVALRSYRRSSLRLLSVAFCILRSTAYLYCSFIERSRNEFFFTETLVCVKAHGSPLLAAINFISSERPKWANGCSLNILHTGTFEFRGASQGSQLLITRGGRVRKKTAVGNWQRKLQWKDGSHLVITVLCFLFPAQL